MPPWRPRWPAARPSRGQDARPQSLLGLDQVRLAGPFSQGFQQPQHEMLAEPGPLFDTQRGDVPGEGSRKRRWPAGMLGKYFRLTASLPSS